MTDEEPERPRTPPTGRHLRERLEHLLGGDEGGLPAWLRPTRGEHRWPAALAIVVAVALQSLVPRDLAFQPRWLLPAVEVALLLVLVTASPKRINRESAFLRVAAVCLLVAAMLATAWSAGRLVVTLARGGLNDASALLFNGAAIWITNVIVFALLYWEMDRGGPAARANARRPYPDFLFPQMASPEVASRDWEPTFVDYLYVSFTNSAAFSPTDTMPLARWAKLAMLAQSAVSLVAVALVIARAVNVLR